MPAFLTTFLLVIIIIDAVLLVGIILLQNKGGGIGILGGGGSQSAFGSRGGDVLSRTTSIMAIIFLAGSFLLAFIIANTNVEKGFKEGEGSYLSIKEEFNTLFEKGAPEREESLYKDKPKTPETSSKPKPETAVGMGDAVMGDAVKDLDTKNEAVPLPKNEPTVEDAANKDPKNLNKADNKTKPQPENPVKNP